MKIVLLLLTPAGLWSPRDDQTTLLVNTSVVLFSSHKLWQALVLREQELFM